MKKLSRTHDGLPMNWAIRSGGCFPGAPERGARKCCESLLGGRPGNDREFNRQTGHHARRVSIRYRNPQNLPDGYEQHMLSRMEVENRQRHLAKEYVEVVKEQDIRVLRYMRPLIVAPVCMNCHGPKEAMTPEVKRIISERYPEDRATGFQEGDLRGAISVKIVLKPEQTR